MSQSRIKATLIKPPPPSADKASIEDVLELTHLNDINPNLFTNTRPLWHPPGARGIYGGAVIAQCLAAAQKTVPENFLVHSMHCYFVLNGNSEIPIVYHVEHVREGRSFATRTVQARQRGQPIFTTTLSFMREGSGGKQTVSHQAEMPQVADAEDIEPVDVLRGAKSPFVTQRVDILNNDSTKPHEKRTRQWIKCRGKISEEGGTQAHLSALAYMSDSYFIGTVARTHRLWRYGTLTKTNEKDKSSEQKDRKEALATRDVLEKLKNMDLATLRKVEGMDDDMINQLKTLEIKDGEIVGLKEKRPEIGMMVSLDHSIYFHNPGKFRADDWLLAEAETPWAGDGRGYVNQRIFARDGTLVASCTQEGVVRLKQEPSASKL
ncbi:putative acyl-CoA thioesterase, HotDog domain superfamily [Septoria linicola]|nr:putative acyl-CoA thioesterase, HotDog domain superfamily [Septoria linicola]